MLTVGGLFSGIGGWELGLERAGMRVVWHCEQDAYCRRVLDKRWPGVPVYPDVCQLRGTDVEPIDVLCGGFPCQDLSYAGRGAGIAGARSGLWSEMFRLTDELRPRYVLVENVPALLARGLDVVLADLASIGFDAEWDCLRASTFGAPHRRERIWLVAYPREVAAERTLGLVAGATSSGEGEAPQRQRLRSAAGHGGPAGRAGHVADPDRAGRLEQRSPIPAAAEQFAVERGRGWSVEPSVGRVVDGFPGRVGQLRALGNALVPQISEWIGRRIVAYEQACNE